MIALPRGGTPASPAGEGTGAPLAWSLAGHAVAVGLLLGALHEAAPPPVPPSYAVSLVAAPPGVRREATAPTAAPVPAAGARDEPVRPAPLPAPPRPAPSATRAPAPSVAAPAPALPAAPARSVTPPARATRTTGAGGTAAGVPATGPAAPARGGPTGGPGADVATVRTEGIAFPFPGYLENLVRQVALNFRPRAAGALRADVAFTIQRDGTVSDLRLVTKSGNYAFDLECLGAIEAVGQRRGFGPLPRGFRDDALPVVFSFDPRTLR